MKYTNPRLLLKVNEVELYDLMLRTSQLLKETAGGGIEELVSLLPLDLHAGELVGRTAQDGLHRMLTYAFTMGVSFAVERQVEAGAAFLKRLNEKKES